MHKLIGYVGTNDLHTVKENDVKSLDVINVAFGHVIEGKVVWNHPECIPALKRLKEINPEIKIVLSVGGWSAGGFSEAAFTKEGRELFASSSVEVIRTYQLDGVDIDWEYPCFSVAGIGACPEDKENYTLLMKELRRQLDEIDGNHYMLTTAVGGDDYFIRGTQMDQVEQYLDYIQLMSYDLRGGFQTLTGHHTNLYSNAIDLFSASTHKAVCDYINAGVPKEKIVIGVAFYSREWKGVPDVEHGLHQMAQTTGGYGPSYSGLVENFIDKNGYVRYWDDEAKAPYLFNGDHFISYDDEESIAHKMAYVKEHQLLGAMYWEYCCDQTCTLTGLMKQGLE